MPDGVLRTPSGITPFTYSDERRRRVSSGAAGTQSTLYITILLHAHAIKWWLFFVIDKLMDVA
ncbi:hypothetical protein KDH_38360 [Dictyobacter sp. S3.2.2.5]|uniref:Uncharacterized protein n=1 Tax=Dictyobacter halimunensis TaxID=3026934 RepID=A0ABQ6FX82_9CHLR|nr:hypothetical protein KDH_38360 [Dictyobacter sp. S3.2.2.5]